MTYDEFNANRFINDNAGQILIMVQKHRADNGIPTKIESLRRIAKTKRRTVKPEGWRWV